MRTPSPLALKANQCLTRGIQLASAVIILAIYSYILATITNHKLPIPYNARVVEGISGFAVLYSLSSLLLLCCLAGHVVASFLALLLDLAFVGAFIFVAVANKTGARKCSSAGGGGDGGDSLDTPFGKGKPGETTKDGDKGFTNLPTFGSACKLQSACLAVAIIDIFFYIFSAILEVAIVRARQKDVRHQARASSTSFSPLAEKNNNFPGSGGGGGVGGFFSRLFKSFGTTRANPEDENALPQHTLPQQLDNDHSSNTNGHSNGNGNNLGEDYMAGTSRLDRHGSTYHQVQLDTRDHHDQQSPYRYDGVYGGQQQSPYASDGVYGGQQQQSGVIYDDSTPYRRRPIHQPYSSLQSSASQPPPPPPHVYDDGVYDRV